jgi:hypothetical protein
MGGHMKVITFVALLTESGTMAGETCLCSNCASAANKKRLRKVAEHDVVDGAKWEEVSANDMAECAICGAKPRSLTEERGL